MSADPSTRSLCRLAPLCGAVLLSTACQLDQEPGGPTAAALRGDGAPPLMAAAAAAGRDPDASGGVVLAAAGAPATEPAAPVQTGTAPQAGSQSAAPATPPAGPSTASSEPAAPQPAPSQIPPAASAAPAVRPRSCTPGTYSGSFSGSLELIQLAALSSINGTVRAELVSDGTQALQLRNARVVGVDQDQNDFTAVLSGRLNCVTHQLEQGKLESGSYHIKSLATDAAFSGEASGLHSDDPPSAVGTWQAVADDNAWLGGRGTWNLVRASD